jgi:hypothetical protein
MWNCLQALVETSCSGGLALPRLRSRQRRRLTRSTTAFFGPRSYPPITIILQPWTTELIRTSASEWFLDSSLIGAEMVVVF